MNPKTKYVVDMLRTIADRIESAEDPERCRLAMLFVGPEREEQAATLACSLTIGEGRAGSPFVDAMLQLTSYVLTGRFPHQWVKVAEPTATEPTVAEACLAGWRRRYARREAWRRLHCPPECGGNWSQACPGCHAPIPDDFQPEEKK